MDYDPGDMESISMSDDDKEKGMKTETPQEEIDRKEEKKKINVNTQSLIDLVSRFGIFDLAEALGKKNIYGVKIQKEFAAFLVSLKKIKKKEWEHYVKNRDKRTKEMMESLKSLGIKTDLK